MTRRALTCPNLENLICAFTFHYLLEELFLVFLVSEYSIERLTECTAAYLTTFNRRAFVCVCLYAFLVSQVVGSSCRNSSVTPRATKNFLVILVSKSVNFFYVILFSSKVNLRC